MYCDEVFSTKIFEELSKSEEIHLICQGVLNETPEYFNDMGLMQAVDNIAAVRSVMAILEDNQYKFNHEKVIAYGHSQGAYLTYLCNRFSPDLFSLIIDNSAWLTPAYFNDSRQMRQKYNRGILDIRIDYLVKKIQQDYEILSLPFLYQNFDNKCKIVCYHGEQDCFHNKSEKEAFCSQINNSYFNLITEDKLDNEMFFSTQHGLNANFLNLFEYTMRKYGDDFSIERNDEFLQVSIYTRFAKYCINHSNSLPILKVYNS